MAFIRNFWQSWPNGISVQQKSSNIRMSVELFPKGGEMIYKGSADPAGVYWLDDMVTLPNYLNVTSCSNMYTRNSISMLTIQSQHLKWLPWQTHSR